MAWKPALWCSLVLAGYLGVAAAEAQDPAKSQYGPWGFDLTAMDPAVKPGDDFNRYANGAWLVRTEIPADKAVASLRYLMSDTIEARLHGLMENAAAKGQAGPTDLEGKVSAFYAAFMDEERVDALGAHPIEPELERCPASVNRK
jgi:putative endopeptidase